MSIKILETYFPEVKILEPAIYSDDRGFFYESYNYKNLKRLLNLDIVIDFVQDNHSCTSGGVLRGMHYQLKNPQGKLIRVIYGSIFDVVVDLRKKSPTFGHHTGIKITSESAHQLWVPPGFAHGFYVLSDTAEVLYKMTDYWSATDEHCLLWNDPDIAINWPFDANPDLSEKDRLGKKFKDCHHFI